MTRKLTQSDTKTLQWMTLRECATQLNCSVESVRTLCLSEQLAYANIGAGDHQRYRIHVDDFAAFLRKRHHGDRTRLKPRVSAIPNVPNLCGK